jgi:hypothetical protein
MKFKIGDTVEIIKGEHRYMIGTVIDYISNPPLYKTNIGLDEYKRYPLYTILPKTDIGLDGSEYKHSPLYFGEEYLKLFNDMNRFKVGGRVKVIKPDHKYYGRVGIVNEVLDILGHYTIYVKFCGYCTPWVTERFEPDDLYPIPYVPYSKFKDGSDIFYGRYPWGDSKYENFRSNTAYHFLYSNTKYEPNVVYTISNGANTDSLKKMIEDYWKRDEQVVKYFIKNLMEENNMSKFKIGDVVVVKSNGKYGVGKPGKIGIVKRIERAYEIGSYYYFIEFAGYIAEYKMREDELDLYNNPNRYLERSSGRYPWNSSNNIPKIKKVIFNCPATIVLFEDGTKSVVKIDENDPVWDPEHGLAMALVKRVYGTNKSHSNYYDIFKKWLPEEKKEEGPKNIVISNNPCVDCPDRKTGCLTNCKKMQDYADECYDKTKKIEDDRVKEIEKKFGEKVRAMREKNKPEEVKKGFIGDFYFKKNYQAQMFPKEFLQFCKDNQLMFYLDNCDTAIDPDNCNWQKITSYLEKCQLPATTKLKYISNTKFHGEKLVVAVDVNYVVFSKKQQ